VALAVKGGFMQQVATWDPEFESCIVRFQERATAAQVKAESLHPFDRQLFIASLREQFISLYNDFQRGYEVILRTVVDLNAAGISVGGLPPTGKKSITSIRHLFPSQEAIEQLNHDEYATQWASGTTPMYQALGLSTQAIATMYDAVCYLLREQRDEEARAAFRLLLVLAPHMADFWMGYAVALTRLQQYEEAITSLEQATSLDPLSDQSLLLLCRCLAEVGRRGEAEARLNARVDEAARRGDSGRYEFLEGARYELSRFSK
jgi:tetratricopeptide (TPR) repeat protein